MKPVCLFICLLFTCLAYAQQGELPVPGQNLYVNKVSAAQTLFPSFDGSNIVVSIKEFRFDSADVDFRGRSLFSPNAAANLTTHANIVASLVGGAGTSDLNGRGAAPGCQLLSSSFVGLMPDSNYDLPHITVQNHSYGINIQNWYGAGAHAYDETALVHPDLLHVFSAGNKGDSTLQSGPYAKLPGFANLTGNFKMAKNVLVVGAVDSMGQIWSLSSRGPAYDGRIKPELMAFGQDGTSGAAALVSGTAAVLQQVLKAQTDTMPYAPLVRAVLINSADDIGAKGPDFESGYGNLNAKNAIQTILQHQYLTGSIASGETSVSTLFVPANARQVKLTLCWNDPPAPEFSPKSLLRDLDLRLLDPTGMVYLPWVLNTAENLDSLHQAAHRGLDTLNNNEQISLDFPISGQWNIQVSTSTLFSGKQFFSLAWSVDTLQQFEWIYPMHNDPAPAGSEVILRWETNISGAAHLAWHAIGDSTWVDLDTLIDLYTGLRRWVLPDTFLTVELRMQVNGRDFRSGAFLISPPLRMKIGFNCPDSVLLYWNRASALAHYVLYGLGAKYLEPLLMQSDTFIVLHKGDFNQPRFAVAPTVSDGNTLGIRSPAPDIGDQGVTCYFRNFLADLNNDQQVDLTLQIGTDYGLSAIFFEKKVNQTFVTLNTGPAIGTLFSITDDHPFNGDNTYRARLLRNDGSSLYSDETTVYVAGEAGWWVYPNPVVATSILHLVTDYVENTRFQMFDVVGNLMLEQMIDEVKVDIPLSGVSPGVYFFRVKNGTSKVKGGKILVK